MVETLGPLQGKQEVFKEGATFKSAPYWSFCELHLPAGLLGLAGRLRLFYYRGLCSLHSATVMKQVPKYFEVSHTFK